MNINKKYELSIWKDVPSTNSTVSIQMPGIENGGNTYTYYDSDIQAYSTIYQLKRKSGAQNVYTKAVNGLQEKKMIVIGSSSINSPLYAYNITLKRNINGTNSLTFKMMKKYLPINKYNLYDNPIAAMLKNDTKLKLKYDGDWYDFLIKSVRATSKDNEIECTATDVYIEELSRTGYSIEFSDEALNNIDNIYNLGKQIVSGTDWSVHTPTSTNYKSDIIRQYSEEIMFLVKAQLPSGVGFPGNAFKIGETQLEPQSVSAGSSNYPIAAYGGSPKWIYIPYSAFTSPQSRIPMLVPTTSDIFNYDPDAGDNLPYYPRYQNHIDAQNFLSDVENYYIEYNSQYSHEVSGNGSYVVTNSGRQIMDISTLLIPNFVKEMYLLTDCRGRVLTYPKLFQKNVQLQQVFNLFQKANPANETGVNDLYFGTQDVRSTFYNCQNYILNSKNFSSALFSTRDISNWKEGSVAPISDKGRLLRIRFGSESGGSGSIIHDRETIQNTSFTVNDNVPNGFIPGERYIFRICYAACVSYASGNFTRYGYIDPLMAYRLVSDPYIDDASTYTISNISSKEKDTNNIEWRKKVLPEEVPLKVGVNVYVEETAGGQSVRIPIMSSFPESGQENNYMPLTLSTASTDSNGHPSFDSLLADVTSYKMTEENASRQSPLTQSQTYQNYTVSGLEDSSNFGYYVQNSYTNRQVTDPSFRWFEQILYVNKNCSYSKSELEELSRRGKLKIEVVLQRPNKTNGSSSTAIGEAIAADKVWCRPTEFTDSPFEYHRIPNTDSQDWTRCTITGVSIQNMQLFKYTTDADGKRVYPDYSQTDLKLGTRTYYKYFKAGTVVNGVPTIDYSLIDSIKTEKDIKWYFDEPYEYKNTIMCPLYEPNCYKISTIQASQSNRYNLIQTLCDNFGCWAKFTMVHNDDGSIATDNNGSLKKIISFHNYSEISNPLGFSYGRNLNNIQRTINSEQVTTKIIVEPNSNEFGLNGYCDISRSNLNPTKEIFFYDFSYYCKNGFLDASELDKDLYLPYQSNGNYIGYYSLLRTNNMLRDKNIACLSGYIDRYNSLERDYLIFDETKISSYRLLEDYIEKRKDPIYAILVRTFGSSNVDITNIIQTARQICRLISKDNWNSQSSTYSSYFIRYDTEFQSRVKVPYENYRDADVNLNSISNLQTTCKQAIQDLNLNLSILKTERIRIDRLFFKKYGRFIKEGTWTSEEYSNDDLYFLSAATVLHSSAQPKVSYTINVTDISDVEGLSFYKFNVGEKTYIEDTDFFGWSIKEGLKTPYHEPIVITEISTKIDDPSPINTVITVKNFQDKFEDMFQKITAQVQSLQLSDGSYKRAAKAIGTDGLSQSILQKTFNGLSVDIVSSKDQGTKFGTEGLTSISRINNLNGVKIINGQLYFTSDGGYTWRDFGQLNLLTL